MPNCKFHKPIKPTFLEYFYENTISQTWKSFEIENEFEIKVEKILHYYRGRSRTEYFTLRLVFAD